MSMQATNVTPDSNFRPATRPGNHFGYVGIVAQLLLLALLLVLCFSDTAQAATAPASPPTEALTNNAQQAADMGNTGWYAWVMSALMPIRVALLKIAENVAVTTLYVCVSIVALSILDGIIYRFTNKVTRGIVNPNAIKKIGTFQSLALSVARYAVGLAAAIYILVLWGIPPETLAVGTAVIGGAIGFGSQGFVQDMITGFSILFEDQVHVGDYVKIGDYTGTVEDVGLRVIKIRSSEGNLHTIFNRNITAVTNLKPPAPPAAAPTDADLAATVEKPRD